jgi:hypothetical protein
LTDPARTTAIEAHVATCDACRARVVAAEAAAAALAATLPAMPRAATAPRTSRFFPALAAAAALAFAATAAFEGYTAHDATARLARNDSALLAMASAHFGHTTLTPDRAGVVAKAIYARDGAWCFVVASGVGPHAHLIARRHGVASDLGPLSSGKASTLFVQGAGRVDQVAIVDDGHVLAHGTPAY